MEQEFQPARGGSTGTLAIDRAAHLLTLLLEAERPRGLAELAADAELPKSTASRLLGALERRGLIQQRGRRGQFGPGPVLLRFAHRGIVDRHLAELAQPHLNTLSAASDETINLAVPTPLGVEHVAQVESRHYLGTGQWIGRRVPYHCTAVGKVLLAFDGAGPARGAAGAADAGHHRRPGRGSRPSWPPSAATGARRPSTSSRPGSPRSPRRSSAPGARCSRPLAISGPTLRLDAARVAELRPQLIHEARALGARLGDHDKGAQAA